MKGVFVYYILYTYTVDVDIFEQMRQDIVEQIREVSQMKTVSSTSSRRWPEARSLRPSLTHGSWKEMSLETMKTGHRIVACFSLLTFRGKIVFLLP